MVSKAASETSLRLQRAWLQMLCSVVVQQTTRCVWSALGVCVSRSEGHAAAELSRQTWCLRQVQRLSCFRTVTHRQSP